MGKIETGVGGEKLAVSFLKNQGFKILETNFRSKFGEIDIIALEKNTVVYIEVKTRSSNQFGLPEEAVGSRKLEHLQKTAAFFRSLNPNLPEGERVDVIAIETASGRVEQIKNVTG